MALGSICSSVLCENIVFRFGGYFTGNGQSVLTSLGNNKSGVAIMQGSQASFIRAWCVFNGSTATILNGSLFSGVVRNSTGNYTLTMSITAPNADFCVLATGGTSTNQGTVQVAGTTQTTITLETGVQSAYSPIDLTQISVAVIF